MCWHSGVKERNQSCPKNSCNEPTLCKGWQKSHNFCMRHLTPWNNWKSPIWFQEPPCKQFTVQGSASQPTQCPKPESVMVCHRTCGLVSGAFDANWSCYIKHLALHLPSQGNILPGRSGTVTSPLPKKCQVWFPPLWHEWSKSLQQEYLRQSSVPQVAAWWAGHQWRTPNQGQSDHWQKTRSVCCQRRPPCETLFQTSVWLLAGSKHNQEKCLCLRVTATSRESPADQEACLGHSLGQQKAASRAGMPNSIRLRMQTWESCMRPSYWVLDHTDNQ